MKLARYKYSIIYDLILNITKPLSPETDATPIAVPIGIRSVAPELSQSVAVPLCPDTWETSIESPSVRAVVPLTATEDSPDDCIQQ